MTKKPLQIHVPKTGGVTIREAFEGHISYHAHTPASKLTAELEAAPWSFAFIRNPWDRMISWYWWRERSKASVEGFSAWVMDPQYERTSVKVPDDQGGAFSILNRNRNAETLLTNDQGEILVDRVYRFENFSYALCDLSYCLGVEVPERHSNRNTHKPAGLDYRILYTPEAAQRVSELCAWEIETFGYEF